MVCLGDICMITVLSPKILARQPAGLRGEPVLATALPRPRIAGKSWNRARMMPGLPG